MNHYAVMLAVAKRIARLTLTHPAEAQRQYLAHLSELDTQERAAFEQAVVKFASEVLQ